MSKSKMNRNLKKIFNHERKPEEVRFDNSYIDGTTKSLMLIENSNGDGCFFENISKPKFYYELRKLKHNITNSKLIVGSFLRNQHFNARSRTIENL
jgi:hypothetical protein